MHLQRDSAAGARSASYLQPALEQIGSALKEHSLAWQHHRIEADGLELA